MFLSVTRLQSVEASHITHRELGKKLFLVWKNFFDITERFKSRQKYE